MQFEVLAKGHLPHADKEHKCDLSKKKARAALTFSKPILQRKQKYLHIAQMCVR